MVGDFRVSRHRCGHGESAIVLLSRVFVPGTGFAGRPRVHRAAEVDVLTRRSPPGATFIARQRSWPGSQGWPEGPSAASRAAASLTARNSPATGEIASDRVPMERGSCARAPCTLRAYCFKRRERLPCLPTHPVPWPEARNLTTSMPREPQIPRFKVSAKTGLAHVARRCRGSFAPLRRLRCCQSRFLAHIRASGPANDPRP